MLCDKKTLKDEVNNEKIHLITKVDSIEEFLQEQRLQWVGHVERMDKERKPVKAVHLKRDDSKKWTRKAIKKGCKARHDC